jgi:hypothetical protein
LGPALTANFHRPGRQRLVAKPPEKSPTRKWSIGNHGDAAFHGQWQQPGFRLAFTTEKLI